MLDLRTKPDGDISAVNP